MYCKLIATLLILATVTLAACNTIHGLGQDIERGGEKLQNSAEKAKNN
jgi:predicted small secreted protein